MGGGGGGGDEGEGRRGGREVGGTVRGVPLTGGPREAAVCCVWEEGKLLLFACVQPRQCQGWGGSEDGVWPEHGVVRQIHCLHEEHWRAPRVLAYLLPQAGQRGRVGPGLVSMSPAKRRRECRSGV